MLASWLLHAPLTRALVGIPFDVADAGRLDRLADVEGFVAGFERRLMDARQTSEGAADLIRRLRSGQQTASVSERAAAVEVLLATERSLGEVRRRILAKTRENESLAATHAPQLLPLFRRMTALIDEELVTYLEAARDLRWEVLALEAEAEPPEKGQVLSVPADVDDFFRSLPPPP